MPEVRSHLLRRRLRYGAAMRIGTSLRSGYLTSDTRLGARWVIERAVAARKAGLDSLFLGDHHVTGIPYYQNAPMLGRLLAEWGPNQVGALFLIPLWHPVLVAEQVGTLASIAEGPFVLQCALGGGPEQFAGMGVDMRRRVRDFEAGLDVTRRLLAGETVTAEEPVPIQGARVGPRPPHPIDVWIGAEADKAIGRAARLGDAWYAGPELTPSAAASKLALYLERCSVHHRYPTCTPIRREVYIADSPDDAERIRTATHGHRGIDPAALVIDTPDGAIESFAALAELGFTDVIIRQLAGDQSDAIDSYRRLAEVREAVADL